MALFDFTYDPNSPRDISNLLKALGKLWLDPDNGHNKVKRAIEELSKTHDGRQLLYNCHLVVTRQIPQMRNSELLNMFKSFQQMTGALAHGGWD